MTTVSGLQNKLEDAFDYLYANAPVRTPADIWEEVDKVLRTGMHIERTRGMSPAFSFSRREANEIRRMNPATTASVGSLVRAEFALMNSGLPLDSRIPPIRLNDFNIAYVCYALSGAPLDATSIDVVGEALEVFRHNWTKRNGGQFFTDPAVTRLAIELLEYNPQIGDDLVDIAAGTGGFLIAGINRIRSELIDSSKSGELDIQRELSTLVKKSIKGIEIDRSLTEIANMTIGSRIGETQTPIVEIGDSLDISNSECFSEFGIQDGSHQCVATNPPFGTKITVKSPSILMHYQLASVKNRNKRRTHYSPTSLDILFLERNLQLLKPDVGRLAIVLPYQLTSGPQAFPVRRWLLRRARLDAVIDLPADTFQPYTGTKTCLVLLRKRSEPLVDFEHRGDERIFMSVPKWIGHDRRGNPIFKVSPDGKPTDQVLTDIDDVAQAFKVFRGGGTASTAHSGSFSIESERVYSDPQMRFNARYYQPNQLTDAVGALSDSTSWRMVKLGDVTKQIFFPGRFKRRYVQQSKNAVPFLGGANISQLMPTANKWISKDDPQLEKTQVSEGWILITRSGSTGVVASVPSQWSGWAVSEHVIRIVPDPDLLSPEYIESYLRTKFAKASMDRGVFGSVIDEITPEFLADLEILVPKSQESVDHIAKTASAARDARERAIAGISDAVTIIEQAIEIHISNAE